MGVRCPGTAYIRAARSYRLRSTQRPDARPIYPCQREGVSMAGTRKPMHGHLSLPTRGGHGGGMAAAAPASLLGGTAAWVKSTEGSSATTRSGTAACAPGSRCTAHLALPTRGGVDGGYPEADARPIYPCQREGVSMAGSGSRISCATRPLTEWIRVLGLTGMITRFIDCPYDSCRTVRMSAARAGHLDPLRSSLQKQ